MNDFAILLVLALPPAAIEFLALVWAKGRLRLGLATAVFAIPLSILGWLIATASGTGDPFARLGLLTLAVILLGGAVTGAVLGGIVAGLRYLRRGQAGFFAERRERADFETFDRLMNRKNGLPPKTDDTL